ncbi:MAG TPA: VOC family protein [Candidatus Kapabacteria bacterium]|nr:VOC family protein [Candidatus Kapabacteria bacterium]
MQIKELGHVVLYVKDVNRSIAFYRDVLGFRMITSAPHMALFSSGRTHHELLLIETGQDPSSKKSYNGLYHIGFKIGDTVEELRAAQEELIKAGVTILGLTDHHVTKSLYILDPDGNELELYVDQSDDWKADPTTILARPQPLVL